MAPVSSVEGPSRLLLDLAAGAGHFFEYFGLVAAIGAFVVRRIGRFAPRIGWANPPMTAMLATALAGGLVLLALSHTWLIGTRVALEAVALVLCWRGIRLVALPLVLAAVMLPLSGHAASVQPTPAGAELNDAVHILSAAMWAGGVIALASLRPPGGWRAAEAQVMLERFGRVAVIAFVVTALTGLLSATEHLAALSDLWTTAYGIWLAAKVLCVGGMLALSLLWRVGPGGRLEAIGAALVVVTTAGLAVLPPPA